MFAAVSSNDCACRQGSTAMPGNSHTKGRRRVRGDGRKAHLRLLQAQILPGSEAFEPVVYLGRIHLVGMLMSVLALTCMIMRNRNVMSALPERILAFAADVRHWEAEAGKRSAAKADSTSEDFSPAACQRALWQSCQVPGDCCECCSIYVTYRAGSSRTCLNSVNTGTYFSGKSG